jgi:hypothetical protein
MNTVKVMWDSSKGVSYNGPILKMIFSKYGAIKDIMVIEDK